MAAADVPMRSRWSGRWVTQSDIDVGERLVLGASSHAIPYFIDIITLLIKFSAARDQSSTPCSRRRHCHPPGRHYSGAGQRQAAHCTVDSPVTQRLRRSEAAEWLRWQRPW